MILFSRHHLNKAPAILFQRGVLACLVWTVLDIVLEEVWQVHHRTEAIGKEYLQNDWSWFAVPALGSVLGEMENRQRGKNEQKWKTGKEDLAAIGVPENAKPWETHFNIIVVNHLWSSWLSIRTWAVLVFHENTFFRETPSFEHAPWEGHADHEQVWGRAEQGLVREDELEEPGREPVVHLRDRFGQRQP